FINREEYTPYGETSFGSFKRKRYRFSGKEQDEESGLHYFEARYCSPWLGRFTSCDQGGTTEYQSLFAYASCNPIKLTDPSGNQSDAGIQEPDLSNVPDADVSADEVAGLASGPAGPSHYENGKLILGNITLRGKAQSEGDASAGGIPSD